MEKVLKKKGVKKGATKMMNSRKQKRRWFQKNLSSNSIPSCFFFLPKTSMTSLNSFTVLQHVANSGMHILFCTNRRDEMNKKSNKTTTRLTVLMIIILSVSPYFSVFTLKYNIMNNLIFLPFLAQNIYNQAFNK